MFIPGAELADHGLVCCDECGQIAVHSVALAVAKDWFRPFSWSSRWVHLDKATGTCRRVDVCSQCLYRMNYPKPLPGFHEGLDVMQKNPDCYGCSMEAKRVFELTQMRKAMNP